MSTFEAFVFANEYHSPETLARVWNETHEGQMSVRDVRAAQERNREMFYLRF
jgi:hypothetical protein